MAESWNEMVIKVPSDTNHSEILRLRFTGPLSLPEKYHDHGRSFPGYKSSPKQWNAKIKLRTQEQPQVSCFSELWAAVLIQKKTRKLNFTKTLTHVLLTDSFPAGFQWHISKARAELIVLVYKGWGMGKGDREGKLSGQSSVENDFNNNNNPFHLLVKQWTLNPCIL